MFYMDYNWDLSPSGIILDEELDIDKLGWKGGDLFEVSNRPCCSNPKYQVEWHRDKCGNKGELHR